MNKREKCVHCDGVGVLYPTGGPRTICGACWGSGEGPLIDRRDAELASLRARVAELEAERDKWKTRLTSLQSISDDLRKLTVECGYPEHEKGRHGLDCTTILGAHIASLRARVAELEAALEAQQAVVDAARKMKFARERFSELQADVHPDEWGSALGALRSTEEDVYAALGKVKP